MINTYYCEKCGGVAYGKVTLTSDFQCRCGVPNTFTEQQRDEFAQGFAEYVLGLLPAPAPGHEWIVNLEAALKQYKKTL